MAFLYDYSGFPRRPLGGDPSPFPRFQARLAEAGVLLAWDVSSARPADDRPAARPDRPGGLPPEDHPA